MILVLNVMEEDRYAVSFDRVIDIPIRNAGKKAEFIRVSKNEHIPDISRYSHVIISGSEASATEEKEWNNILTLTIHKIIEMEKPLLGICYGHQFIVRALAGENYVRKSGTPEFGWQPVDILDEQNDIFCGISDLFSMVSHYDEVYNLPGDFKVLASTSRCAVHAFQYKNLPVWGVQFHPEYRIEEATEIFDALLKEDPLLHTYIFNMDNVKPKKYLQNHQIIENFLK